jgi:hypothetical protein
MQIRRIGREQNGLGPFLVALGRRRLGDNGRMRDQYQNSWLFAYCSSCWLESYCVGVR